MAVFTYTAKLDAGAHGTRCTWTMAVHHAVGISRQRNSSYRPSRVNIMTQGLFTPDASLSPTHLTIRRGRTTTTHYTHDQVSLMVLRNTTLVLLWGCTLGQPVRQTSALACKGSVCHPKGERKERRFYSTQGGPEWCLCQASKSNFSLPWPWPLSWHWSWSFRALALELLAPICIRIGYFLKNITFTSLLTDEWKNRQMAR